ncbi:hypothetical protein DM02DRAFT_622526 [Periconia macrospinosa]|uniref:Uncharacterized protein n=1 Tax=Periconia macrospinosa TaxID=97972 RepID=A0A2V1E9F5_9PLEO|nr:hypothetical protein DM02DRAFT_622526 [Periconia macrospinosa]
MKEKGFDSLGGSQPHKARKSGRRDYEQGRGLKGGWLPWDVEAAEEANRWGGRRDETGRIEARLAGWRAGQAAVEVEDAAAIAGERAKVAGEMSLYDGVEEGKCRGVDKREDRLSIRDGGADGRRRRLAQQGRRRRRLLRLPSSNHYLLYGKGRAGRGLRVRSGGSGGSQRRSASGRAKMRRSGAKRLLRVNQPWGSKPLLSLHGNDKREKKKIEAKTKRCYRDTMGNVPAPYAYGNCCAANNPANSQPAPQSTVRHREAPQCSDRPSAVSRMREREEGNGE